ncbi:MAG: tRNA1(Val) (adenine(37)-N6)-methyltransferase [Lachnospiraceae bacterium]|nr:tRNA1(Val) (adenine(37)-N6)-methyltransferase [Lachnospiraceae bacterium]
MNRKETVTLTTNYLTSPSGERICLKPGERADDLQLCGLYCIQDPDRFCFGMDAVLLSGFTQIKEGETCLDLGTGTGILPLLLSAKTKGRHFTGLEIQEESAEMAARSVRLNGLEDRIDIVCGDIREADTLFERSSFDVITGNPPYMTDLHGLKNPAEAKAIARHEVLCSLDEFVNAAARLVRPGGRFYMVHRPFRIPEIFETLKAHKLEPKKMRLVHPYVDREPSMVLIESVRGGKPRMKVEAPLIIYNEEGSYSEEIRRDYGF